MAVSAKVIADSKFRDTRLITLEVEMHRFIFGGKFWVKFKI